MMIPYPDQILWILTDPTASAGPEPALFTCNLSYKLLTDVLLSKEANFAESAESLDSSFFRMSCTETSKRFLLSPTMGDALEDPALLFIKSDPSWSVQVRWGAAGVWELNVRMGLDRQLIKYSHRGLVCMMSCIWGIGFRRKCFIQISENEENTKNLQNFFEM